MKKKGRPKKLINETITEPSIPTKVSGPTEDEIEAKQLRYLLNELNNRNIHDLGTLGIVLERLEKKIQAVKA